jgi:CheY-like chemotaxis protein
MRIGARVYSWAHRSDVENARMSDHRTPPVLPELAVLVAEDNALNQKIIVRMVRGLGCTVDAALNGVEVLAALQRRRYDIILMDIRMPDMNGLEATRRIRRDLPLDHQPRIYALTAGVAPDERQACFDAGMDGFVAKPVVLEQLALLFSSTAGGKDQGAQQ